MLSQCCLNVVVVPGVACCAKTNIGRVQTSSTASATIHHLARYPLDIVEAEALPYTLLGSFTMDLWPFVCLKKRDSPRNAVEIHTANIATLALFTLSYGTIQKYYTESSDNRQSKILYCQVGGVDRSRWNIELYRPKMI